MLEPPDALLAHRPRALPARPLGLIAALLVALAGRGAAAQESVAWTAPHHARLLGWSPEKPAPSVVDASALAVVHPKGAVTIPQGQVLLVPVSPGDRLEVEGEGAAVGLGSGEGAAPDVITWLPPPAAKDAKGGRREVIVPSWSSARFLAIRGSNSQETTARVHVAARAWSPLAWHRFDDDIAAWLEKESGAAPPELGLAEASVITRRLAALRGALGEAAKTRAGEAWLMAKWLEASARIRPLGAPYFTKRSVSIEGGREAPELGAIEGAGGFVAAAGGKGAGSRLVLRAPSGDVLRIALRANGRAPARVLLREGSFAARSIAWEMSTRPKNADPWTPPRWVRAVVPVESRMAIIEVLEGEVAVAAAAHTRRLSIGDWSAARRDRVLQLDRAQDAAGDAAGDRVIAELASIDRSGSAEVARSSLAVLRGMSLSPSLRALVELQAAGSLRSPSEAPEAAARAWKAASALKGGGTAPLLRQVLERLAAVHLEPVAGPMPWSGELSKMAEARSEDGVAMTALAASLSPPRDGLRPVAAPRAEDFAIARPEVPDAAARARETWKREAPWAALAPKLGTPTWTDVIVPERPIAGGALCDVEGPNGPRFTLLRGPRTEVTVTSPQGTHARLLFRGATNEPEPESIVFIDKIPVTVHAGAGLASVVAVAPGARVLERPSGAPPVLAHIPREGQAPCESLREVVRWARAEANRPVELEVPEPGRETIARIFVDFVGVSVGAGARGAKVPRGTLTVRATVGHRSFDAWIREGATGSIEVPIAANEAALRVTTSAPAMVRASARAHPAPLPPARITSVKSTPAPEAVDALLAQIRRATQNLEKAPEPAWPALHAERAAALLALGFTRLAALDRSAAPPAAGKPSISPAAALDLKNPGFDSALESEPSADVRAAPPRARRSEPIMLPPGAPAVVPLGLLPKIPPLPLPADPTALRRMRSPESSAALSAPNKSLPGASASTLAELAELAGDARASSGADGLLFAILAARAGLPGASAEVLERIGVVHKSGAALSRAASLWADAALTERDPSLSLRSYITAQLAADAGEVVDDLLARLSSGVAWRTSARPESAAGSTSLEMRGAPASPLPLGVRVRRALVDAPDDALLLTEGERLAVRLPQRASLVLESGCYALDAAGTACSLEVTLNGARVPCPAVEALPRIQTQRQTQNQYQYQKCRIEAPEGRHRLEARLPGDAIAWTRVTTADGRPLETSVTSEWIEIDPARPLALSFAGPTVVRVQARSDAGAARTLRWSIASGAPESAGASQQGEILTDPADDPIATRPAPRPKRRDDAPPRVSLPVERRLAVKAAGPHLLRVESPLGRALLRVDFAIASGLPKPRAIAEPPPPPPALPSLAAPRQPDRPPLGEDPPEGPLMVGARVLVTDGDFADDDSTQRLRYLELGAHLNRELADARAWTGLHAFARLREGPPSFGGELTGDFSPDGLIPGGYLRGRAVVQTTDDNPVAVGLRASAGLFWSVPLFHSLALVPSAGVTLRRADATIADEPAPDRDVYTRYAETHPRYAILGARLHARPFIDGFLRFGASARLGPAFSTLDRLDVTLELDVLAGRGLWPWIGVSWLTSYRPVTDQRPASFVRDAATLSATFWKWLARGQRLSLGGDASAIFDLPSLDALGTPSFAATVFLQYDYVGGRGLRDLPPFKRPFQDRQEEGSGRVERQRAGVEPAWEASP